MTPRTKRVLLILAAVYVAGLTIVTTWSILREVF